MYDPNGVVELRGALGWQIMIEFADDERIENVSIGDSLAWQVTPNKRAKMLFLKPLLRNASTNMTVVTSQRRYAFSLSTGPRSARTPWVLQFEYPAPPEVIVPEPVPLPPVALNFGYVRAGHPGVMPTRVWDDGRQTYFEFGPDTPIPAIFAAGPGKKDESLVNVVTRGRVQVVQQTGPRFILRTGTYFATVTRENPR
jgi:type IV secretion system protein VirB9